MAVAAVVIGWLFGYAPAATVAWSPSAVGWGVLATLPPLAMFLMCVHSTFRPLVEITRVVDEQLTPLFRNCHWFDLAAVSLVAGIGEELLFRGLAQGGLAQWIGPPWGDWIGLCVAGIVFGLLHPITRAYAVMAGAIGLYLGGLWMLSGNLLTPITTHAMYDFTVLFYLVRFRGPSSDEHRAA